MTTTVDIGTLISRTPGLHGGVPHISGKGVTVRRIVSWYKRGLAAEDIGDRTLTSPPRSRKLPKLVTGAIVRL